MAPFRSDEDVQQIIEESTQKRLKGNQALKEGNISQALKEYHSILLTLKGLEGSMDGASSILGTGLAPGGESKPEGDHESHKHQELKDQIKELLAMTYFNMSVVQLKRQKAQRALDCALDGLKLQPENDKGKYREAMARIALGQHNQGREILQTIQKKNPDDASITTALKQLEAEDKVRAEKSKSLFRGMYNKKQTKSQNDDLSVPATRVDANQRFQELEETEEKAEIPQ